MAAVTLGQFKQWVEENRDVTWFLPNFGKTGHAPVWKYIDIGFDTRTEEIFFIKVRGQKDISVHVGDIYDNPDCKNILDILSKRIKEYILE